MDFDFYLEVVASYPLGTFIGECGSSFFINECEDCEVNTDKFKTWMKEHENLDIEEFLDSIEIDFDWKSYNIIVKKCEYEGLGPSENDETDFNIWDYVDLILFGLILRAIKDKDDRVLMKFSTLFEKIKNVSLNNDNTKIIFNLFEDSTHGSVDIDFCEISKKIKNLKNSFRDIEVKTYIGLN